MRCLILPNFPKVKKEISEAISEFIQCRAREYTYLVKELKPTLIYHRGSSFISQMGSNEGSEFPLNSIEAGGSFSRDLYFKPIEETFIIYDQIAKEFGEKMEKSVFDMISKTCEDHKQTSKFDNTKPSVENFLDMILKVEIEFDKNGQAIMPQLWGGKNIIEFGKKIDQEMKESEEFRNKFDKIMEEKKRKWIEKENSRKLVG